MGSIISNAGKLVRSSALIRPSSVRGIAWAASSQYKSNKLSNDSQPQGGNDSQQLGRAGGAAIGMMVGSVAVGAFKSSSEKGVEDESYSKKAVEVTAGAAAGGVLGFVAGGAVGPVIIASAPFVREVGNSLGRGARSMLDRLYNDPSANADKGIGAGRG